VELGQVQAGHLHLLRHLGGRLERPVVVDLPLVTPCHVAAELEQARRGRRGAATTQTPAAPPRKRTPITDPLVLKKSRKALALARAARAERLAEARAAASQTASE
jgi:hypothetical protein